MRALIALAVVILLSVAAWQLFNHWNHARKHSAAAMYESAIAMMEGNPTAASEALMRAAQKSSGGMSDLAMFDAAKIDLMTGKIEDATVRLEELANNGATKDFRDLATLYLAVLKADQMEPQTFEKFLSPLVTKRSPFYYTAQLFIAQKYLSVNDSDSANIWLDRIIRDESAPAVISATAESLR